jgi:hypothetical protein
MAAAAMALDRATLGAVTATGGEMRARQNDQVGFTDLRDAALAVERSPGGAALAVRYEGSYEGFKQEVATKGAILLGEYYVIPDSLSCQPSFNSRHALYVNEHSAALGYYAYDPLCSGPRWYPEDLIARYAARLAGAGKASAAYTEAIGVGVVSLYPGFGASPTLRTAAGQAQRGLTTLLTLALVLVGLWLYAKGAPRRAVVTGDRDALLPAPR